MYCTSLRFHVNHMLILKIFTHNNCILLYNIYGIIVSFILRHLYSCHIARFLYRDVIYCVTFTENINIKIILLVGYWPRETLLQFRHSFVHIFI